MTLSQMTSKQRAPFKAAFEKVFCQNGFNLGSADGTPKPTNSGKFYVRKYRKTGAKV